MAKIIEISGNIFNSKCQVITNTVNCEGVMGRGVAVEFKYRYPKMFEHYVYVCRKKLLEPGKLLLWEQSTPLVLNFPTKFFWKLPSKIEYIELGLKKFTTSYKQKKIRSIAFPQLGSDSGGLNWNVVRNLMYHYLEPLPNLIVEIYKFNPKAEDKLFKEIYEHVVKMDLDTFKMSFNLEKKQANILFQAFFDRTISTMYEMQQIEGIGEKSIQKVYSFLQQTDDKSHTQQKLL